MTGVWYYMTSCTFMAPTESVSTWMKDDVTGNCVANVCMSGYYTDYKGGCYIPSSVVPVAKTPVAASPTTTTPVATTPVEPVEPVDMSAPRTYTSFGTKTTCSSNILGLDVKSDWGPQTTKISLSDCQSKCTTIPGCVGISYADEQGGFCKPFMGSNIYKTSSYTSSESCYYSSIITPGKPLPLTLSKTNYTRYPNKMCTDGTGGNPKNYTDNSNYKVGNDLGTFLDKKTHQTSLDDCQAGCDKNEYCQGVTFMQGMANSNILGTCIQYDTGTAGTQITTDNVGGDNVSCYIKTTPESAAKWTSMTNPESMDWNVVKLNPSSVCSETKNLTKLLSITSRDDCKKKCIHNKNCNGIQFYQTNKQSVKESEKGISEGTCYFHDSKIPIKPGVKLPTAGFENFQNEQTCYKLN